MQASGVRSSPAVTCVLLPVGGGVYDPGVIMFVYDCV